MYRFVIFAVFVMCCNAQYNNGYKMPIPSAFPSLPVAPAAPLPITPLAPLPIATPVIAAKSYAAPVAVPVAYAAPQQSYGPIEAAVQTRRTFEVRETGLLREVAQPQVIEVGPNQESVLIHFRTASSALNVRQSHIPAPEAPVEHTSSQDNAHRLVHEVIKPVIQEVREVIQPYRRINQEIRPVIEEIHTVVNKGERRAYVAPLPLTYAAPAYGPGAAIAVNAGYKAAKAA